MSLVALAITVFGALMSCYYVLLYVLAGQTSTNNAYEKAHAHVTEQDLLFVIVVPARNEAVVIQQTVERLVDLQNGRLMVLIMDDGSDDGTGEIAERAMAARGEYRVLRRGPDIAGRGKGDVLNHAYEIISELVVRPDMRARGVTPDNVIMGILDADGWLEPSTLPAVSVCFTDPNVSGVQLPVRMWNARAGFLARMQDIEFAAYARLFQAGRERMGSVLMGGNGQFLRLSSLDTLGGEPWTDSLTEDLDIGLRLVERGWRHRFCPDAFVAQQALCLPFQFVRQRTRWVQGHLACWSHMRALWSRRSTLPLTARLDLTLHLFLGAFGLLGGLQVGLVIAAILGYIQMPQLVPATEMPPPMAAAILVAFMLIPILLVASCYQRSASSRLPLTSVAGVMFVYAFYHYLWGFPATCRAIGRIVGRRRGWSKTARALISQHDLAAEAVMQRTGA